MVGLPAFSRTTYNKTLFFFVRRHCSKKALQKHQSVLIILFSSYVHCAAQSCCVHHQSVDWWTTPTHAAAASHTQRLITPNSNHTKRTARGFCLSFSCQNSFKPNFPFIEMIGCSAARRSRRCTRLQLLQRRLLLLLQCFTILHILEGKKTSILLFFVVIQNSK